MKRSYTDCKHFIRTRDDAPRCHHFECALKYYKQYPYRLLIIKKALEDDRQKVITTFGTQYIRNAERIIRDLDNNRAA